MEMKILVVDDEMKVRELLHEMISRFGYECKTAASAYEALGMLPDGHFEIVISDIKMPGMDGIELLKEIKTHYPDIDVVSINAHSEDNTFTDMIARGASDFMLKPFSKDELEAKLNRIVRERNLKSVLTSQSKALQETKDHLENIIASSLDCIVVSNHQGYITKVNRSFLTLLGYNEEEVKGKTMTEFSPTEVGTYTLVTGETIEVDEAFLNQQREVVYKTLFVEGKVGNGETHLVRKDKKIVLAEENIVFLQNEKGEITGAVGIIRDITERKKAEVALKQSEEKYHGLIENANDAILLVNEGGVIVEFNKKAEKIFGYTRDEIVGKPVFMLSCPAERAQRKKAFETFIATAIKDSPGIVREGKGLRKDGEIIFIESSMFALESEGKYILTSFIRDITERKRAEEYLRETRDYLNNIIENSLDCIILADNKGFITKCNQSLLNLLGRNEKEVIGSHTADFSPTELKTYECTTGDEIEINEGFFNDVQKKITQLRERKKLINWETYLINKDSQIIPVEENVVLLNDTKGKTIESVSVIRDITHRKKAEREIQEAKEFLENIFNLNSTANLVTN
jgi:PAS domain S-box-containing protein